MSNLLSAKKVKFEALKKFGALDGISFLGSEFFYVLGYKFKRNVAFDFFVFARVACITNFFFYQLSCNELIRNCIFKSKYNPILFPRKNYSQSFDKFKNKRYSHKSHNLTALTYLCHFIHEYPLIVYF